MPTLDREYHIRQYKTPYETTLAMLRFMDDVAGPGRPSGHLLDVACGAGANCTHMLQRWPVHVTGIDMDETLLDFARQNTAADVRSRSRFLRLDLFELPKTFGPGTFDFATLMQTLLLFGPDGYPNVLRSIAQVTKGWVFLSSLFTDKQMDVCARIRDYTRIAEDGKDEIVYTTLCMSRFERVCKELGCREVIFRDFSLGIDLAPPPGGGLGTYTAKLADGGRLQISGAVYMPWKLAALRFGA